MDWRNLIRDKLVSADEAVKVVKSGDRVVVPVTGEPLAVGMALCARRDELRDVQLFTTGANFEFPWFSAEWEDAFQISLDAWIGPFARPAAHERRADFSPRLWSFFHKAEDEQRPRIRGTDVLLIVLSPPNRHGFCSFGRAVWHKKDLARRAKIVVAEIDEDYMWTYGENFIHISEVDLFVEAPPRERRERPSIFLERPPETEAIAGFVSELVRDGDTIQIGQGSVSAGIVRCGAFDGKNDLGWHSETTPAGVVGLVKKGIFTSRYKTHHKGKMVASAFRGEDPEEAAYVDSNPMWELYGLTYVN
ncbi:MAG: hypothetical protein HY677_04455, partial [Chloroflexi bacterium]|nr:hypothetical protein [Chloroflexota bacterium]